MVYTKSEKRRLERILGAFQDYIRGQSYFDIVYSEKAGYLRISAEDPEGGTVIQIGSSRKLLDVLVDEVLSGETFAEDEAQIMSTACALLKKKEQDVFRMISEIFDQMEDEVDKMYCFQLLEEYKER